VWLGQVDDDALRVLGVLELRVQVVAGGEEQLTGDGVDRGHRPVCALDELAVGVGEVGDPAGERRHGDQGALPAKERLDLVAGGGEPMP